MPETLLTTVLLEITQQDKIDGHTHSCCYCPVAIALKRLVKPGIWLRVEPHEAVLGTRSATFHLPLPEELSKMIIDYDRGLDDGKGCEFELEHFPRQLLRKEYR